MKKLAYGFVLAFAAMSAASAFAAGELPSGYTEVEYIQGDGSSTRILTDYTPNHLTDKIEAVVGWDAVDKTATIWCTRGATSSTDSWTVFMVNDSGYKFRLDYGTGKDGYASPLTVAANTIYTVTAEDKRIDVVGGAQPASYEYSQSSSFADAGPIMLFASYWNGTGNNLDNYGKNKLYSFKVWRSGTLIHYFVPCKDSGGAATLVDICDNPATLTKSGTFTVGGEGHYFDDSLFGELAILPISTQHVLPGFRPEPGFTITNRQTGAIWVFGEGGVASGATPFDIAYSYADGVGTVTATGKAGGEAEGEILTREYVYTDEFLINGGFESGSLVPGWTGSDSAKAYVIDASNGHKPNYTTTFITGTYCGMLKQTCSMQQVFTCESPCRATLSWKCKHRCDWGAATVNYKVLLDDQVIYPDEAVTGSDVRYRSVEGLVLSPGEHTLKFDGWASSDTSLFLDDVSLRLLSPLEFLPIPDQPCNIGDACRPVFTVSNVVSKQVWTIGGNIVSEDFEVVYSNNTDRGTATVTVSGLGAYAALTNSATFKVYLPVAAGLTNLEYVEFTGAQYVNTGLLPVDHQLEFEFQTVTYVADGRIFGTQDNGSYYSFWENNNYYGWGYNGTQGNTSGKLSVDTSKRRRMVYNRIGDNAVMIDGTEYATGTAAYSKSNLFIARREGSNNWKGRVFFVRATNRATGKVELELVPAKNADGVAGFYDRVSGRFLTAYSSSSTLTPLVAGPEVKSSDFSVSPIPVQHDWSARAGRSSTGATPTLVVSNLVAGTLLTEGVDYSVSYVDNVSNGVAKAVLTGLGTYAGQRDIVCFRVYNSIFEEYRPLEYIESTNTAAWIGSDYIHTTSTRVEMVSYVPKAKLGLNSQQYHALFGARRNSNSQESFNFYVRFGNINKPVWTRNAETGGTAGAYPYDEWVALNCGTNNGLTASWEGLETGTYGSLTSSKNVNGSVPLAIFCLNSYNGYGHNYSLTDRTVMKLKSFKVYENDKLVHDYIPCRRLSDGAIGLYEPYWNQFYVNRGTSDLVAGRDVAKLQIAYEIPDQAQVGYAAVTPAVVVTDYTTGETLTEGVDYTVSYVDNTAPGTGRVVLTGIGDYAGEIGGRDFKIYDGGPATPYPNLSRSYVPGGLVGFWDGIDNAGTGTHDPAATTWVDLSGHGFDGTMNGIATWKDGNAMHNEADGQPCTLPLAFSSAVAILNNWINNTTFEFGFRPSELSAVRAIFSNYTTASYGTVIAHNGSSFTDGALRFYNRNTSSTSSNDVKINSVVKANELARFTLLSESRYLNAYRDHNFVSAVYSSNPYCYKSSAVAFVIGGQPSDDALAMRGDIHFVRVYNRVLAREEMEFNRALDRIRYDNLSYRYALPEKLPDGYAYDAARDVLRVRISANAIPAKGLVSINGGAASKYAVEFVDVGSTVTLAYSGDGFVAWTNIPSVCSYPSGAASGVVTFTAGVPVAAMVDAAVGDSPISALTAYSYVQKGLIRLWDGIDNLGTGVHVTTTNRWVDLTGSGAQWVVRSSASFGDNCLTLVASSHSASLLSMLPSYDTAEFCFNLTAGRYFFSNADDYSRVFAFFPEYGSLLAQRYSSERAAPTGYSQLAAYNRPDTYAVTYHDIRDLFFDIKYYQNGQLLQPGCGISSSWATGSYPALGSRYGIAEVPCAGSLYSVRMYDRPLTEDELRFNAALDRVRYFGADAAATFANITLPDGYRWNSSAGRLEVRVDIETRRGTSSVASGTWFAVGDDVTVDFTPSAANCPVEWKGRPFGSTLSADGKALSWKAAAPASILVSGDIVLPALSYVSKGLIGLWDAKENVAPGVHDVLAEQWYDLTGHQQEPWTLIRGRAAFLDDALQAGGYFGLSHPIVQYSLLPDWKTVEAHIAPMMTNGTKLVLSERLANRFLYIGMLPGANFFGGYKSATAECATDPEIAVPYVANTYSLAYEGDAATPSAYYIGGRPVTEKKTASCDWSIDNDYPTLGSRYNQTSGKMLARYYVLRMYDRDLTATEVAFNAAVDKVRYGGARFADVVPATLPDGYRYDSSADTLEVKVSVFAAEGAASVNGGDTNVWVEVGKPVEIVYTPVAGRGVRDWTGLPGDARLSDVAQTARFTAAAPVEAAIETAATSSELPASMYVADSLIASWDALDEDATTEGWSSTAPLDRRANAAVFDGTAYMYNTVAGVKQALSDKSLTVQLFLRPKRFMWNGAYLHIGTGKDVRDIILSMQGERSSNMKSQRGAFGALQCAGTTAVGVDYSGIRKDTTEYFGEDTLVSIVRSSEGGKVSFNDEDFCVTNSYYSNPPTTDLVNIGSWLGARNATFDLYAVRIYNRVLTKAELEYNGSVDRARFCGEAIDLPEGYTNDEGVVKAFIAATVTDGTGQVSINGSTPAASASAWLPLGSTANVTFTPAGGYAVDGWTGVPSSASYFDVGNTVSFKVGGPLELGVSGLELSYSDDNFTAAADLPSPIALGNNTAYAFTSGSHTLVAKNDITIMQALVVGGGGAGGANCGGGGGGGGVMVVERPIFVPAGASLSLFVGTGGAVAATASGAGGKGEASSLAVGDLNATLPGGGGGGGWSSTAPTSGGHMASGGGRANKNTTAFVDGWDYDSNYGCKGGISMNNDTYQYYGPGGGGAASAGESTFGSATACKGGSGILCSLSGTATAYGAGGGGGGKLGGAGGGTLGGTSGGAGGTGSANGTAGVDGTGSGGGGGGNGSAYYGGKGGDGIVIFSFASGDKRAVAPDVQVQERVPYVGVPAVPEVVVTVGGVALVKDVDFRVDCSGNTAPGFGTATISGLAGSVIEGISVTKPFIITQVVFADVTASGTADGSSWANAMAPQNALNAAATAFAGGIQPEVWFKNGTYLLTATLTIGTHCTLRGGFAGTESSPGERAAGAMSTLDGQGACAVLTISNGAYTSVVVDGFRIFNGLKGIVKTGAGDISVLNSDIVGNYVNSGGPNGVGLALTGTADAKLVVSNCVVSGNHGKATNVGYGQGIYVDSFGSALITDTTFLTNGLAWTAPNLWDIGRDGQWGAAIYLKNAPATVSHCVFRGNRGNSAGDRGGIVRVNGTSGGTLIDHCVFAGNEEDYHTFAGVPSGGMNGGQIVVSLATEDARVIINNCTIAGNYADNSVSATGVTVSKGTVVIKNSIIANNITHPVNTGGEDLALVDTTAHAEVSYSVLSADGPSSYSTVSSGNLSFGAGMRFGDPELVSSVDDVDALLVFVSSDNNLRQFDKTRLDEVLGIDVHALSPEGYFTNDGVEHFSAGEYSRAIDAGDRQDPVGDEPSPNGGIVNAGAYGGTAQASKTPSGAPAVDGDVTVAFEGDYSQPTVRFVVGGTGAFFAQANVFITTNDVDWVLMATYDGLSNGAAIECLVRDYYAPGYVCARVTLSANGSTDIATSEATAVTKPLPPWWRKGGPANVIHVRPGAIGTGSGDNWSDAVPDLRSAFSLVSAEKNEIWLAGTNVLKSGSVTLSVANPLVIRGGFHGWEDLPEEREDGFRSVIDGDDKTDCLTIANTAAVEVERIYFTRGLNCGLIKTGAGDMRVSDCHFFTNGMDRASNTSGKGARVSGTAATTVVTFVNCLFRGNRAKPGSDGGCSAYGAGIYAATLKCLRIEDCTFVHNGIHLRAPGGGSSYEPSSGSSFGSAVYSSAPVSAVGCRFAANFGNVRNNDGDTKDGGFGGVVRLTTGAEGSAFTNCAWVANGDEIVWQGYGTGGKNAAGALVVFFGSNSGTVDVERCTFAYNLADGYETPAGLNIILGTVNVHNSIFFGNIIGGASKTRGRDISLRGDSVCNVSYTLFGELGSNSVTCAETATTNFLDGIVVGDPLFVTEYATMANLVKESSTTASGGAKLIFWDWTTATLPDVYAALENVNVHLRGGCGYFDETTGEPVREYAAKKAASSPAIDAGDPKSEYKDEPDTPAGWHGRRVNLGAYGNTPWATLSPFPGAAVYLR